MSKENSKESNQNDRNNQANAAGAGTEMTASEFKEYLAEIERKVVASAGSYFHSVIALNELMRQPNIEQLLDAESKQQMCDLWIKLKASGILLNDPPLLFGLPENFASEHEAELEDEEVEEIMETSTKRVTPSKSTAKVPAEKSPSEKLPSGHELS